MNLIIAGGRDFDDYPLLCKSLDHLLKNTDKSTITVFSGQAKGADSLGEQYAKQRHIPVKHFPADWDKHGKKAGILRNQEMLDAGASHLVAFWDGVSKGTADMVNRATKAGLHIRVVKYEAKEQIKPRHSTGISNIKREEN